MPEIIAVFDLEGTLCQGGQLIWRAFIKRCYQQRGGIFRIIRYIISQTVLAYLHKLGLRSEQSTRVNAIKGMATLLNGLSRNEMSQFAELLADQVTATLRPDTAGLLKKHRGQGHQVILVSNLFQPLLEAVGRRLGIHHIVGTGLELNSTVYSGRVSTPICNDKQRATMIKQYLRQAGIEVDFGQSYAYGDTKWDKPVLELAGHPVAVYPDEELRAYAQSRSWQVIG